VPSDTRERSDRPPRERPRRLPPERRRRGDVIAAAVLAVLVLGGAAVLWGISPEVGTESVPAAAPIAPPPAANGVPAGFTEAWRAPSNGTDAPIVAGPAVVTADASRVSGRDAGSGAEAWSYTRDLPLCTAAAAFPGADDGAGRVLALYEGPAGYCSELTALRPDTGVRAAAGNPDARPGTRLLASSSAVVTTGTDYLEVLRSDLVKTLEYGAVPTPVQAGRQPRPGCTYGSVAITSDRLGVVERCPDETTDRLTVLSPDGPDGADQPQVQFSVALPGSGAVLVAVSGERAAVALPGPPRLLLLDRAGQQVGLVPLDVPAADLAADPPGGIAPVTSDGERVYWWSGSQTIALDAADLTPLWTLPGALGPAVAYGGGLLVPVPAGLVVLDAATSTPLRTIPVARPPGPVRLATAGDMLLEQRGPEVVALRPTG
jgi:hypothetical protein